MKKVCLLFVCTLVLVSLSACGGNNPPTTSHTQPPITTTQPPITTAPPPTTTQPPTTTPPPTTTQSVFSSQYPNAGKVTAGLETSIQVGYKTPILTNVSLAGTTYSVIRVPWALLNKTAQKITGYTFTISFKYKDGTNVMPPRTISVPRLTERIEIGSNAFLEDSITDYQYDPSYQANLAAGFTVEIIVNSIILS